jgi:hypothetical protein
VLFNIFMEMAPNNIHLRGKYREKKWWDAKLMVHRQSGRTLSPGDMIDW